MAFGVAETAFAFDGNVMATFLRISPLRELAPPRTPLTKNARGK
jgi:hypothetical protein